MSYTSSSIQVLKGLEACRKRPGMYIGNLEFAAFQMLKEVLDNSIDEHLAKHCNEITITLHKNGFATVEDNGRGIPVDIHKEEGISAAIVIMTQLHAGGKFDQNSYKVSGGLHGVGVSVTNALSNRLNLTIYRDGFEYFAAFEKGEVVQNLITVGKSNKHGTKVSFIPDETIVENIKFDFNLISKRLEELAYLNPGLKINLIDEEQQIKNEYFQPKGIVAFVEKFLTKKALHEIIEIKYNQEPFLIQCAFVWSESYSEDIKCFTNNIPQQDGGTHLVGFKTAITRTINNYLQKDSSLLKKLKDIPLTSEDMREGIVAVISVYMPDPQFSSQTKEKLVSSNIRSVVEQAVIVKLEQWLEENPDLTKEIFNKIQNAAMAREAARKSRDLVRNNKGLENSIGLAKTLYSCYEKDPAKAEIFLVEGESAGGTAKSARNPRNQAILPLRGKILNVEKANFAKMLNDEGIRNLIAVMGTNIGENFDITKIKYNKIILMTDADVDGSHILVLLITFFFKYMREVIENGYLYVAQPPLYGIRQGNKVHYLLNDEELAEFLFNKNIDKIKLYKQEVLMDLETIKLFIKDLWKISKNLKQKSIIYEAFLINKVYDIEIFNYNDLLPILSKIKQGTWEYFENQYINNYNGLTSKFDFSIEEIEENYFIFIDKWNKFWGNDVVLEYDGEKSILLNPYDLFNLLNTKGNSGLTISRFKGLGEMMSEDLRETIMKNGNYKQVTYNNEETAEELINVLMGEDVLPRKEFLSNLTLEQDIDD